MTALHIPELRSFDPTVSEPCLRQRPWLVLAPEGTVVTTPGALRWLVPTLAPGSPVAVESTRPLSRPRLRRLALAAGVEVCRELIVLPTVASPLVVLDDSAGSVGHLWESVAAVPPGLVLTALPCGAFIRLMRALPWQYTGLVAPGRVLIGRTS